MELENRPLSEEHDTEITPEKSNDEWNRVKATIHRLYIDENRLLDECVEIMERDYNFKASVAEYRTKLQEWQIIKNQKQSLQQPPGASEPEPSSKQPSPQPVDQDSGYVQCHSFCREPYNFGIPSKRHGAPQGSPSPGPQGQRTRGFSDPAPQPDWPTDTVLGYSGELNAGKRPNPNVLEQGRLPTPKAAWHIDARTATFANKGKEQPIHLAAAGGEISLAKILLEKQPGCMNLPNPDGCTALHIAAGAGNIQLVRLLVDEYSAAVNVTFEPTRGAPMHEAAFNGHEQIVRFLLEKGANADPRDGDNITPLILACQHGFAEVAQLLLEKGADPNIIFGDQLRRPIHQATKNGHVEAIQLLIKYGADVNAADKIGWTPLMAAALKGQTASLKCLLEASATVNHEDNDGATSLYIAARQGHTEIVKILLNHGALASITKSHGRHPIHIAALEGHLDVVEILVERFPDCVNLKTREGFTSLGLAAGRPDRLVKRKAIMEFLIERGAQVIVD